VEEALYDSPAMRRFVGIDLGREPVPDETTVCRFRHLLEEHDLGRRLFDEVQRHLAAKGLKVATGTIVDATISMRRPRLRMPRRRAIPRCIRRRKGNQWYFGLRDEGAFRGRQPQQADPRGGGDTGQCCRQHDKHDAARFVAWLHGRETRVWGDQAYRGQRAVIRQHAPRAQDFVNRRYRHRGVVDEVEQAKNRTKSKVRANIRSASSSGCLASPGCATVASKRTLIASSSPARSPISSRRAGIYCAAT
jgi:IS5 family transposase